MDCALATWPAVQFTSLIVSERNQHPYLSVAFTAGSAAGFFGLGILVLIPGAYASTIAAGAWLKVPGFKFEMMPQMARSP